MKISILAIMVCLLCTITSYGQSKYAVKGTTVDTINKTKLTTTVTVLNAKDSILQTYTHTGPDGSFTLPITKPGTYLLWVTYPDYASYEEKFVVSDAAPIHNFGNINMQDRAKLLQEVVINGGVKAIKIKGDTTEYNAKAFVIQPNDKVEDLLKQLPDVQVDKDGKITAQGKSVPNVLVDGEEFFSNDPLLVTRNIRADMVDKVQIYDRKSDQAKFTGIDDGKTTKTINITLKEDKKTGVFGKVLAGKGNDGYYDGQAMFNKFKGKYKLSAYATTSNIGKNGLGLEDQLKLGNSSTTVDLGDGGGISIYIGGDDYDNSTYSGRGIPQARSAGAHYDTKWNKDKESINTNYKMASTSLNTLQNVDQTLNYSNFSSRLASATNTYNHTFRQKADLIYQNNFNATTSLKFTLDGSLKNTDNSTEVKSSNTRDDGTLINKENRNEKTNGETKAFNAGFLLNKKLKKDRRTLSWNVSENFSQTDSKRFVNGVITTPAKSPADSILKQYQPVHSVSSTLNSNITYTEPISAKLSLVLNYGLGFNNRISDRESYNQSSPVADLSLDPNRYDILDPTLTNDYKYNQMTNQIGALFNYKTDKTTLTFGTKATDVGYTQTDQRTSKDFKRSFINWTPQLNYRYKVGPSATYNLTYNGSASQPSIDQIQPTRVNTNPLNITVGNPNLGPSYSHRFSTYYNASKSLSGQYIYFSANYSFQVSPIVNKSSIDPSTGKQTTQFVNLTGYTPYSYSFNGQFSRRVLNGITAELDLSSSYNANYSYINDVVTKDFLVNQTGSRSFNASAYLQKNVAKKYSIYVSGGPGYSTNTFSARPSTNYSNLTYNISSSGSLYLPGKFQIASDYRHSYQGPAQGTPAVITRMWNASIIKTFLKGDNLKFTLSGNNLLNQDQFQRSVGATGITLTNYNTIKRYFMLSVSWDFTKFGTIATPAQN